MNLNVCSMVFLPPYYQQKIEEPIQKEKYNIGTTQTGLGTLG